MRYFQNKSLHIGLCGPMEVASFGKWLPIDFWEAHCKLGLGGSSVNQLALALLEEGHRVTLYTLDKMITKPIEIEGERLSIRMGMQRRGIRRLEGIYGAERLYLQTKMKADAPDIIHAHWTYEYALAGLASELPLVITVRDWAPDILRFFPDKAYRFFRLCIDSYVTRRAKHLIANSQYIKNKLDNRLGRPVPLIPNGLVNSLFAAGPKSHGFGSAPHYISALLGLDPNKNTISLLGAFKKVRKFLPNARLTLMGRQLGVGQVADKWARSNGLNAGVTFAGFIPHGMVLRLLQEADIYVHPAHTESFGSPLLEAMAQGLPCIGGQSSGAIPWVLGNGTAGLLCDVSDMQSIAHSMIKLATQPDVYNSFACEGYSRANREFRMSEIVRRTITIYRSLLYGTKEETDGKPS